MTNFENVENIDQQPPKMRKDEFIDKTKSMLKDMLDEYASN